VGGGGGGGGGSGDTGGGMVVVEARVYAWQRLSRAARFGGHAPGGHKRPLLPMPLIALMAQLAKALQTVLIILCLNLVCAFFFFSLILLLLLLNNYKMLY